MKCLVLAGLAVAVMAGSAAEAERVIRTAGIDPGLRGEALGAAEFARIALARHRPGGRAG